MREIKFDIVVKNDVCINHKKYYISEIASGLKNLFDVENWQIIAFRQFTGYSDKNGNEIYYDDIYLDFKSTPYTVDKLTVARWIEHCDTTIDHCEVIGNIHENPELLETP